MVEGAELGSGRCLFIGDALNQESEFNSVKSSLVFAWENMRSSFGVNLNDVGDLIFRNEEFEVAFGVLVDCASEYSASLVVWKSLDRAARKMRLYSDSLGKNYVTSADVCRRYIAAASEDGEF